MLDKFAPIGREISKDKYLAFLLILILLVAFIRTSNPALEQLLVTAVGGLLGLMRSQLPAVVSAQTQPPANP